MGAAASVEPKGMNLDYQTLKCSSMNFESAHSAIEIKLQRGKSEMINKGDVSINFLALRQLSQNMRNQESLERTRQRFFKTRSIPNDMKYQSPGGSFDPLESSTPVNQNEADNPDLDHHDLAIIDDAEYSSAKELPPPETLAAVPKKKGKPNLFLQVNSVASIDENEQPAVVPREGGPPQKPASPSAQARVSPRGTLYMGKFKVMENGIFPDTATAPAATRESCPVSSFEHRKRSYIQDHGYVAGKSKDGTDHWQVNRNDSGEIVSSTPVATDDGPMLPALGGKKDFIEISTLGSGASGVVSEAIHVPSLTLVALKILPIYNQEKRQHVSRELAVLFRNLTEMRLVDDRLDPFAETPMSAKRCPNVLSLYNAFVDPRSGMINLVIEYMDGGSLEDLVKVGGCRDEQVLGDIAYQTLNGLCFLHKNKHVHRDIKPANILCSSQGLIKIADFGISKALDKSSGFANSFVGTVCYMSPERITGDVYSFSCDIWSLGLTLLAVSRGRFPISLKDKDNNRDRAQGALLANDDSEKDGQPGDEDSDAGVIGGPGGYWAMIKAICDNDAPKAGPEFSHAFNAFIDTCLQKDPNSRGTAKTLMQTSFVLNAASPGKYDWSPEDFDDDKSTGSRDSQSGGSQPGSGSRRAGVGATASSSGKQQTPLTARLNSVTVAKAGPNNPALVADGDDLRSGKSARTALMPPVSEDEETSVITAIRLEHLERVLEKLEGKLKAFEQAEAPLPRSLSMALEADEKSAAIRAKGAKSLAIEPQGSCDSLDQMLALPKDRFKNSKAASVSGDAKSAFGGSVGPGPALSQQDRLRVSARSVHFDDSAPAHSSGGLVVIAEGPAHGQHNANKGNLRARLNLKALELDVDDADDGSAAGKLPKPSSYFIASQSKDERHDERSMPVTKAKVDYSKIIPRFDHVGLSKWNNLAHQLHLPIVVVQSAVRSALGKYIHLEEDATSSPS